MSQQRNSDFERHKNSHLGNLHLLLEGVQWPDTRRAQPVRRYREANNIGKELRIAIKVKTHARYRPVVDI